MSSNLSLNDEDFLKTCQETLECIQSLKAFLNLKIQAGEKWDSYTHSSFHVPIVFVRLSPINEQKEETQLLQKIADAIGWDSQSIHQTFLIKDPELLTTSNPMIIQNQVQFFFKEIMFFQPKIIICWGEKVSQWISGSQKPVEELRKNFIQDKRGFTLVFSWDPFFILKNPELKKWVWQDIKKVHSLLHKNH